MEGRKDGNQTLIDDLLDLQKKFMQNAGRVSPCQQSNGCTGDFMKKLPTATCAIRDR